MRTEITIALLASTALHAGLIFLTPATPAPQSAATPVAAVPIQITARLKNTLDTDDTVRPVRPHPARTPRPSSAKGATVALSTEAAPEQQPYLDNPQRFYPPEAIAQGIEGEAILLLRFAPDGALTDAQIAKSSGYAILDEAALRAVRAAPRFAQGRREMLLPVSFALQ
jgi:periplasmic protein TonB